MFIKAFDRGNVRGPAVYFRNRRKRRLTTDLCLIFGEIFHHIFFPGLTFSPQIPSPKGLCQRSEILENLINIFCVCKIRIFGYFSNLTSPNYTNMTKMT